MRGRLEFAAAIFMHWIITLTDLKRIMKKKILC